MISSFPRLSRFSSSEYYGKSSKGNWKLVKGVAANRNLPLVGGSDTHGVKDLNTNVSQSNGDINCIGDLVSIIRRKKIHSRRIF
ncbi:MAG: hypothetical protein ACTSP4_07600 [Candidatus Hodarchaeales archaeon]